MNTVMPWHALKASTVGGVLTLLLLFPLGSTAIGQSESERDADAILKAMGDFLAGAAEFSVQAQITYDEFADWGQEVQYGGHATIALRRPNKLHIEYHGDHRQSQVVFDGESLVFLDVLTNLYARMEVPGAIDGAVDELFERYGYSVPVADFLYADPYGVLSENTLFGVALGKHRLADGKDAQHLAFSGAVLDWQIWIEDGPTPFPRQLVITYKEEPGAPQYRVRLSNWSLKLAVPGDHFRFVPPAGSGEMDFLPIDERGVQEADQ